MPEEPLVVSISSGTSLNPDEIARRGFSTVRKGADPEAVRRYLESVASDVRALLEREAQLRRHVADAERRASEPPEIDEAMLTAALGSETARVLQSAHDAARDVVARAEERAAGLLSTAETVLAEKTGEAEEEGALLLEAAAEEAAASVNAARGEAEALRSGAIEEAATILAAAQAEAARLVEVTRDRCRTAVREARAARRSVLSDLVERRHSLIVQLEQLRSGRDSLAEAVGVVEATVSDLRERLAGAEEGARAAAAEAGNRAEALDDDEMAALLEPEVGEVAVGLRAEEPDEDALIVAGGGRGEADGERGDWPEPAEDADSEGGFYDQLADEGADEAQPLGEAGSGSHRSVGELFARLRASREPGGAVEPATGGSAAIEGAPGVAAAEFAEAVAEAVTETDVAGAGELPATPAEAVTAAIERTAAVEAGTTEAVGGGVEAAEDDTGSAGIPPVGDAGDEEATEGGNQSDVQLKERRDAVLAPVLTRLSRSLKRALQDDQNELLNAIRHASGAPDLEQLLPLAEQRDRYALAASGALADGWLAGRSWLRTGEEDRGGAGEADDEAVGEEATATGRRLGGELADELAGLLRHRLEDSIRSLGELGDGIQDAAGAAYREWKGPRIEGIAGDFATQAFSAGAVAGAPETMVRWVVDDPAACPDCDDNALAGDQVAGETWPTGQVHPPAHPGCRCLLVTSD